MDIHQNLNNKNLEKIKKESNNESSKKDSIINNLKTENEILKKELSKLENDNLLLLDKFKIMYKSKIYHDSSTQTDESKLLKEDSYDNLKIFDNISKNKHLEENYNADYSDETSSEITSSSISDDE